MGLSMFVGERISLKDGAAQERNFHTYAVLGPADAPVMDVHIVPSTNAVFAATGKRMRAMPIGGQLA